MKDPKKLSLTFQTTQDVVSPEDLADAVKTIVEKVKESHSRIVSENKSHKEGLQDDLDSAVMEIERRVDALAGDMDSKVSSLDAKTIGSLRDLEERLSELCDCVDEIEDFDPSDILSAISVLEGKILKMSVVDGVAVRDALASLEKGERLRVTDLDGFEDALKDIKGSGKEVRLVGGTNGIQLYVDGEKKGNIKYLNLVAGSGVTLAYSQANGRNDVVISASGGSGGTIITTNAPDDVTLVYPFASKPSVVVVNGASYRENKGWSWNSGTLEVTLDSPVGSTGDIYGIS